MLYLSIAIVLAALIISIAPIWLHLPGKQKAKAPKDNTNVNEIIERLKKHYGAESVGILTEVKTGNDYTFAFYTEASVNGNWFLKTGFFNVCPDYFTLENELRLIDDMKPEKASIAYSREAVDNLLNELSETAMEETNKNYYTDLLLEVRGLCA
jgi:hypothetical protein